MLLLPTIIVPGYLNDLAAKPDPAVMAALEQRGYRIQGASPGLFWFTYPSRRLGLEEAARALSTYVREVVLPKTYSARINVVAYSLGGLLARWNLAFEPGWSHLVTRFVMVGVPNEGAVLSYVDGWYPLAAPWARTPAARNLLPTFPFWRPTPGASWGFPPDGQKPALEELNTHPLPDGIRAYAFACGFAQRRRHGDHGFQPRPRSRRCDRPPFRAKHCGQAYPSVRVAGKCRHEIAERPPCKTSRKDTDEARSLLETPVGNRRSGGTETASRPPSLSPATRPIGEDRSWS